MYLMELLVATRWRIFVIIVAAFACGLFVAEYCFAQETDLPPMPPAEVQAAAPVLTEAEQITRLQRTIAADEKRIEELRCGIADPTSEYYQAETEFRTLDDRSAQEKADLAKLTEPGQEEAAAKLKAALAETEKKRQLARARFDLAIQTRKTLQEQMAVLEGKVQQDKLALGKLTGAERKTPPKVAAEAPTPPVAADPRTSPPPTSESPPPTAAPAPIAQPAPAAADVSGLGALVKPDAARPPSQELIAAKQSADVTKQAADEAEEEVRSVTERLDALDKSIVIEQKLLTASRQKSELANQTRLAAEQEYREKSSDGLMGNELAEIATRRADSDRLFQEAEGEVRTRMERLTELQTERSELQREQLAAQQEAKSRQNEATAATERLGQLKNPFALHNVIQWLLNHGPALLLILSVMYGLYKAMHLATRRIVEIMVQSSSRSAPEENEARVNTLVGVFQNAATLTIIIGGGIMLCEEAGIAVAPLMGGAAVLGLAVAFGAQNLIRDYFYGFVILLENQYKINDVLKIGEVSGQVERITLRMTVLRDLEGCVHFIPNGKIDCVSNMTHGWSRAVFDIGVSPQEDPDQIMNELLTLAADLRRDPAFARLIIDDAEMLGVDDYRTNGVTIKFLIKTRPLKQWAVKRELLRRINRRFQDLGIDTSMPQHFVVQDPSSGKENSAAPAANRDRKAA